MQNDPGWKFRQKTGQQEFLNSAAAKGLGRSGGTMKDFINYNQDAASQEYGQVYNRALGEWNTDYSAEARDLQHQPANAANIYNTNTAEGHTAYNTNRANAADIYNTNAATGLTAYNTNRGNAFQNYQTNFGNALQGWQANTANNANVYNTNWGAQKDVYNAAMQGWQGTNALNTDIWKTQNANADGLESGELEPGLAEVSPAVRRVQAQSGMAVSGPQPAESTRRVRDHDGRHPDVPLRRAAGSPAVSVALCPVDGAAHWRGRPVSGAGDSTVGSGARPGRRGDWERRRRHADGLREVPSSRNGPRSCSSRS